jgi:hypothetical protein
MGESEDVSSSGRIAGTIPLFFYDLIGRIVPGAALILGLLIYVRRDLLINWLSGLQEVFPKDSTAGYAAAIILLFFSIAHFCGVILSSLSHLLIETIWKPFFPLNLRTFSKHYGLSDGPGLQSTFRRCFGVSLGEGSLDRASALCAFYVWRKDSNLGLLTARADADLLGARSLVLVCLILLGVPLFHKWTGGPAATWAWFACLSLILVSSVLTFNYLREKKVFMRCALFLASTSNFEGIAKGPPVPKSIER